MKKLKSYAELVKFQHTIFALPFALASILLLGETSPPLGKIFWIILALVSARTLGMAFNRLIDEPFDRLNPRTQSWPLVSGELSREDVKKLILFSAGVFSFSALMINFPAFLLSPVVIFLLWLYPYSKRFTSYPHFVLGTVYFLIPVAVDVALNEEVSLLAMVLGLGMACWVAGFDILYSLQDYEFDREHGIGSVPARFGIKRALEISRLLHGITFLSLLLTGILHRELGVLYFLGLLPLAGFLVYEHRLISPEDLSRIDKAFFTVNGYVSMVFLGIVFLDFLL